MQRLNCEKKQDNTNYLKFVNDSDLINKILNQIDLSSLPENPNEINIMMLHGPVFGNKVDLDRKEKTDLPIERMINVENGGFLGLTFDNYHKLLHKIYKKIISKYKKEIKINFIIPSCGSVDEERESFSIMWEKMTNF